MNWKQQLMVNNSSWSLLALQCFFKRVSRSEVFFTRLSMKGPSFSLCICPLWVSSHPGAAPWEDLVPLSFKSLSVFSLVRSLDSIHSWMSFQMFPLLTERMLCFSMGDWFFLCVCFVCFSGYWLGSNRKACFWAGFQPSLLSGTSLLLPDREQVCLHSHF